MKRTITTLLRLSLCVLAMLFALPSSAQTGTISIGSGTANSAQSLPVYTYYYYTYSQQIVKASEFAAGDGAAGPISKIRYYLSTAETPLANWNNWTVYMGHTSKTSFASTTDWEPLANLEQVFTGTVTQVAGQWMEITFNTPFVYDGTSNIIVAVDENSSGYTDSFTSTYFGSYTGAANTGIYYASDGTNPDPATPPTGTRTGTLPRIQFVGTLTNCIKPTGVQTLSLTPASVTLGWTPPAVVPAEGYEYVLSTTNTAPANSDTGTDAPSASVVLPVNQATTYYFWVRSKCSSADKSSWTTAFTFTTPCDATNVPYTEDFESVTVPALPACTSIQNAGLGNNWTTNSPAAYGFTTKALRYNYSFTYAANAWFYTRGVNLTAGTSYRISYKYGNSGNTTYVEKLKVAYGTSPSAAAMTNPLADHPNINSNVAVDTYIDFTPSATGTYYFGFNAYSDANKDKLYVDNITVDVSPTCLAPTNLQAMATSASSIDISWSAPATAPANGYEYYVSTDALDAPLPATDGTDVPTGTSATYAAMENTAYYIWVRSKCAGADVSQWVGPVAVATPCTATDIPYMEDFESVTPPALPDCTTAVKTGAGNIWVTNASTVGGFNSNTLRYNYTYAGAANTWFFTQGINLTAGTSYRISYKYGASSATYIEKLKVAYGTSATAAGMVTQLADYPSVSGTTYNTAGIDFVPATSGVYYFGFQAYSASGQNYLYVDDIMVDLSPSCLAPTNLQAQATSPSSIDITWSAPATAPANGYEYYVSTDAFDAPLPATDGTDVPTGTSATYAAMENTAYYIWVRSKCAGADVSEWTGPVAVATPCTATDIPYVEDFESVTPPALPDCTAAVKTGAGNIWVTNASTAGGFNSNTLLYNYTYAGAANTWFFTQGINLTAGTSYRISYKYGASSTTYVEKLKVAYGTSATAAGMVTQLADYPSISGTTYNTAGIDFVPATSGVYYFGFQAYSASGQNYLYVDDIMVNLSPTCFTPLNVQAQATGSSIDITWNAPTPAPANGYEYYVATDVMDVPGAATVGTGVPAGTSAMYQGMSNTQYYIYVRSKCTGEDSEWSQMVSVTTPCAATDVPYVQDFESATTPALPECTTAQNAGTGNNWTTNSPAANGFTSKVLRYSYNLTNAANAWFFTQGINLTAGVTYRISYKYGNSGNTTYIEKLKVSYGTSANASAMNTLLADHNNINSNVPVSTYVDFTPPTTGVYYFGFNAYSNANQDRLYVDDITVDTTAGAGSHSLGQFTYYPNPVKDVLNLSYTSDITSVEVFNMLGQKVLGKKVDASETSIDMTQLPDGNYILNVSTADAVKSIKVVKKQ